MLRGDLAAEWGANSGEGRQRAGCVGGNFLLRFTRHMLNVYIVSGAAASRCFVAASVRCHYLQFSLFDIDETLSHSVCDFRPVSKQLWEKRETRRNGTMHGRPGPCSLFLSLFWWVFLSASGLSNPNYSFLFTYVNAEQRATDWQSMNVINIGKSY